MNLVAAVNRPDISRENLLRAPDVVAGLARVTEERGHASAGAAYNVGFDRCGDAAVMVFIHQDVYLPAGFVDRLEGQLAALVQADPDWAVAGVWGVCPDGRYAGRVWCSGGGQEHRGLPGGPHEAASIDEIVIILNTRHGLRFDENLPGFHLYATDIVMQARVRGLKTYVLDAPVVHNSRRNPQPLDRHYRQAYRYMQKKWAAYLPLKTAVVPVTRWGLPMYRQVTKNALRAALGLQTPAPPHPDPRPIAWRLGYEPAPETLQA